MKKRGKRKSKSIFKLLIIGFVIFCVVLLVLGLISYFGFAKTKQENQTPGGALNAVANFFSMRWLFNVGEPVVVEEARVGPICSLPGCNAMKYSNGSFDTSMVYQVTIKGTSAGYGDACPSCSSFDGTYTLTYKGQSHCSQVYPDLFGEVWEGDNFTNGACTSGSGYSKDKKLILGISSISGNPPNRCSISLGLIGKDDNACTGLGSRTGARWGAMVQPYSPPWDGKSVFNFGASGSGWTDCKWPPDYYTGAGSVSIIASSGGNPDVGKIQCGSCQRCAVDGGCEADPNLECDPGKHCANGVSCTKPSDCVDGSECSTRDTTSCWASCNFRVCGDKIAEEKGPDGIAGNADDEECDNGRFCVDNVTDCTGSPSKCKGIGDGSCRTINTKDCWANCKSRLCGDKIVEQNGSDGIAGNADDEECDPGKTCANGADCTTNRICSDGSTCSVRDTSSCTATCKSCGDYMCDDGNPCTFDFCCKTLKQCLHQPPPMDDKSCPLSSSSSITGNDLIGKASPDTDSICKKGECKKIKKCAVCLYNDYQECSILNTPNINLNDPKSICKECVYNGGISPNSIQQACNYLNVYGGREGGINCEWDSETNKCESRFLKLCKTWNNQASKNYDIFKISADANYNLNSLFDSDCTVRDINRYGHGTRSSDPIQYRILSCMKCDNAKKICYNDIGCSNGQNVNNVNLMSQKIKEKLSKGQKVTIILQQAIASWGGQMLSTMTIYITEEGIQIGYIPCSQMGESNGATKTCSLITPGEIAQCTDDSGSKVLTKKCCSIGDGGLDGIWLTVSDASAACPLPTKTTGACKGVTYSALNSDCDEAERNCKKPGVLTKFKLGDETYDCKEGVVKKTWECYTLS